MHEMQSNVNETKSLDCKCMKTTMGELLAGVTSFIPRKRESDMRVERRTQTLLFQLSISLPKAPFLLNGARFCGRAFSVCVCVVSGILAVPNDYRRGH